MIRKRIIFFKEIPFLLPREELLYAHVQVKKVIFREAASKSANSAKVETLSEDSNRGSGNVSHCEGLWNPLAISASPKGNSNGNKLQPKTVRNSFIRDRKPLEEGCNRTNFCRMTTRETICEQHISCKKNDGEISLKRLNQFFPCSHFKIECLQSIKDILKKDNFTRKLHLKDLYFCIPLSKDTKRY